jgi:Domain of unknown function (DUF4160)
MDCRSRPTVLRIGPHRFFFYAGDRNELSHTHVAREINTAKFWLNPVGLQQSGGFHRNEITRIQRLVEERVFIGLTSMRISAWRIYCLGSPLVKASLC